LLVCHVYLYLLEFELALLSSKKRRVCADLPRELSCQVGMEYSAFSVLATDTPKCWSLMAWGPFFSRVHFDEIDVAVAFFVLDKFFSLARCSCVVCCECGVADGGGQAYSRPSLISSCPYSGKLCSVFISPNSWFVTAIF
jgi:hypothetical protein